MIKVENVREWYRLLKECREHVASVYGQRNKRQIFDALIILGVVYMAYYLFWDKEDGMEFEEGGDVDYTPAPQTPPAPAPVQAPPPPPRPEMPEPTYNGQ